MWHNGSPGSAFSPAAVAQANALLPFKQDGNWFSEFMKRVWPSIAKYIGKKMDAKLHDQGLQNLDSIMDELGRATKQLEQVPFEIPPSHHWLNKVLEIFWPILSQSVDLMVKEKVVPSLQDVVPSFLGVIDVNPCSLGSSPPKITQFKVLEHPISSGWMDIQCDLEYHAKPELKLCLGNKIEIGLTELDFSMTFYISFHGPMPQPPFFAGMSIYMSKAPRIATTWTGLVEMLTQDFLNSLIEKAVKGAMVRYVLPHRKIKLMTEESDVMEILQPRPRGCLQITVIEARDLVGNDYSLNTLLTGEMTTDPYVKVSMGSTIWRSSTIENNVNPEWNEETTVVLLVDIPDQQLVELSIFDDGFRQRMKQQFQMGDSSADEVARLQIPLTVTDLLEKTAAELTQECQVEKWLDLVSWWPGKGEQAQHAQAERSALVQGTDKEGGAGRSKAGDEEGEGGTSPVGRFFQQQWDWMKDKVAERNHMWEEHKKEECLRAEAKIKIRVHWKPMGEVPEAKMQGEHKEEHDKDQERRVSLLRPVPNGFKVQSRTSHSAAPLGEDSNDDNSDSASSDEEAETESDSEHVGWPAYVMSIALRKVDKVRCMEDDLTTTFQVASEVNRVVAANGTALSKTTKNKKDGTTRQLSRAQRPIPATIMALGRSSDEDNEALASKIGTLMQNDVPMSVIADVLDISEKLVKRACGNAMTKASKLREVEYNESMLYLLPDMEQAHLFLEFSSTQNKKTEILGSLCLDFKLDGKGVHRMLDKFPLEMAPKIQNKEDSRLTACIKIWPFVKKGPGLSPMTQADELYQQSLNEAKRKLGGGRFSTLRITSAKGLRKADLIGHSDPYCVVRLGKQKKATLLAQTKVVDNTPDPEWNHGPVTVDWDTCKELKFEVWDKDISGAGDLLGEVVLEKTDCKNGVHTDFDLGDGNGSLLVEVAPAEYKHKEYQGSLYLHETRVPYKAPDALPVIEVSVKSAENLKGVNIWGGLSDPFVICTLVGKSTAIQKPSFRTPVISGNLNPTWNHGPEEFTWRREAQRLVFEVRDKDLVGSKAMGKASLDKDKCLKGFDGTLSLGKGNGKLHVIVKLVAQGATKNPLIKLRISIIRAEDLRDADMFGHSDPYCQCKYRGKALFQTEVVWDNPNPEWNHRPEVVDVYDYRDVSFDVYDKDLVGQDDFLGSAVLMTEMCEHGYEGALSLGVGSGSLQVKIERLKDETMHSDRHAGDVATTSANEDTAGLSPARTLRSLSETVFQRFGDSGVGSCSAASTFGLIRDKLQELVGASPSSRSTKGQLQTSEQSV